MRVGWVTECYMAPVVWDLLNKYDFCDYEHESDMVTGYYIHEKGQLDVK